MFVVLLVVMYVSEELISVRYYSGELLRGLKVVSRAQEEVVNGLSELFCVCRKGVRCLARGPIVLNLAATTLRVWRWRIRSRHNYARVSPV